MSFLLDGFRAVTWQQGVMYLVGFALIYLAIQKDYEPALLTRAAAEHCENHDLTDCMVIGTSALIQTELDSAVNIYAGCYNNPFVIWGKYRKILLSRKYRKPRIKASLPVSFQFHHTQMDGAHAGRFLQRLQETIDSLRAGGARHGAFGLLR